MCKEVSIAGAQRELHIVSTNTALVSVQRTREGICQHSNEGMLDKHLQCAQRRPRDSQLADDGTRHDGSTRAARIISTALRWKRRLQRSRPVECCTRLT
jgi:hypothetical protein